MNLWFGRHKSRHNPTLRQAGPFQALVAKLLFDKRLTRILQLVHSGCSRKRRGRSSAAGNPRLLITTGAWHTC
jgi:hypothetical protein